MDDNTKELTEFQEYVRNLEFSDMEGMAAFADSYYEHALKTGDRQDVLKHSIVMTVLGGSFIKFAKDMIEIMKMKESGNG